MLDEILSYANAVNEAWDNRADTGATYAETEEALIEIAERSTAFYEQVQHHPIPRPVQGLGEGPKNKARPIAEHANRILARLRLPAHDLGFERLAALDDLNHAADRLNTNINHVIYEVHAKAHISGLGTQT